MTVIPVVFATDRNYLNPVLVMLDSLVKNASDSTKYEIYALIEEKDAIYFKEVFKNLNFKIHKIKIIKIDGKDFEKVIIKTPTLTKTTFYRLIISEILIEKDKCIYLDCDIVVNSDLRQLYQLDIEDYYLAGVRDYSWCEMAKNTHKEYFLSTGLTNPENYINAGVLLMNLKKIRDNKMSMIFLQHAEKGYLLEDQDVLNICCEGKIYILPIKYNFFTRYKGAYYVENCDKKNIEYVIIHYAGSYAHPWSNFYCRNSKVWWGYLEEVLDNPNEVNYLKNMAQEDTQKMKWEYILKKCKSRNVIIFGFSDIGKEVAKDLINAGINLIGFCDNDPRKRHNTYMDLGVLESKEILKYENVLVINTSQYYYKEIHQQLINMGIEESNIIRYYNKNSIYYDSLDEKYYFEELKQIFIREQIDIFDEKKIDVLISIIKDNKNRDEIIQKYFLSNWLLK